MSSLNINSTLLSAQSYGNRPVRGSEIPAAFRQAIARAGDQGSQGTKAPVRAQANGSAKDSSGSTSQNGQAPRRPLAPGSLINIVV